MSEDIKIPTEPSFISFVIPASGLIFLASDNGIPSSSGLITIGIWSPIWYSEYFLDSYNEIDVSDEISLIKKEVKDPEYGLIDLAFDKEISDPILYVGGSHLALILYLFGEELS